MRSSGARRTLVGPVLVIILLAAAFAIPSAAPGNDVSTAKTAVLGGGATLTFPANNNLVYSVTVSAGDAIIGYTWAPGTEAASGNIRLLPPEATDISAPASATANENGILYYVAPVKGTYAVDFVGSAGKQVTAGLFVSRARISVSTHTITVPYNGTVTLHCTFADPDYTYLPYDGTKIPFEFLLLKRSFDGTNFSANWWGRTDVAGTLGKKITGVTRKVYFTWNYDGAVYDSAGLSEAHTSPITIFPRVNLQAKAVGANRPKSFTAFATLLPKLVSGDATPVVEARKKGSNQILQFPATVYSTRGSTLYLRSTVTIPSTGTWTIRWHRVTDARYAETATKWVTIRVR